MGTKVSKTSGKMVIGRNFGLLVFFPLGCCFSCWASASGCGAQIWGCNGVGDGHVLGGTTSFFPWCECETIRALTLSCLVVPWLREIRLWKVNRSFTKWWRCDRPVFRLHESAWEPRVSTEAPQMHRYGWQSSEPIILYVRNLYGIIREDVTLEFEAGVILIYWFTDCSVCTYLLTNYT